MIKKDGFLLIELLVALAFFSIIMSVFSYFIYTNLYTREITVKRFNNINEIVNYFENPESKKDLKTNVFNVKTSKEGDFFRFGCISNSFYDMKKRKHKIMFIGSA
jgi:Tfp pilus assembly protein PilE